MAKRIGIKRRRNYYQLLDQKKFIISQINNYQHSLKLMQVTGVLCFSQNICNFDAQVEKFSRLLKVDYENKFQNFIQHNLLMGYDRYKEAKFQKRFEDFYKIRTGNLPNIHILFWLKLIDFRVILNNFVYYLDFYGEKEFDDQLNDLEFNSPWLLKRGKFICLTKRGK